MYVIHFKQAGVKAEILAVDKASGPMASHWVCVKLAYMELQRLTKPRASFFSIGGAGGISILDNKYLSASYTAVQISHMVNSRDEASWMNIPLSVDLKRIFVEGVRDRMIDEWVEILVLDTNESLADTLEGIE